jgi:hypothetical protein
VPSCHQYSHFRVSLTGKYKYSDFALLAIYFKFLFDPIILYALDTTLNLLLDKINLNIKIK